MLNLFFNTKITGKSANRNLGEYFYPVTYPNSEGAIDPIDVLLYTIISYSSIIFDQAFFNIDLGGSNSDLEKNIEATIQGSISANKLHISFSRPSTLNEWKASVAKVSKIIGENSVLLVAMNHDHPFVDYTSMPFIELTNQLFSKDSYKKVLYYSHAPELLSWALNGKDRGEYSNIGNYIYRSSKIDNWLDSFCLMTSQTLMHILECAVPSDSYMGRIDWPGINYRKLDLTAYISSREYFKHYDGYGHVTGLRLISSTTHLKGVTPKNMTFKEQCNFYYQKWLDVSILSLKDRLAKSSKRLLKKNYISHVDCLFDIFKISYLQKDRDMEVISSDRYEDLVKAVYERIYLDSNNLIMQINLDNMLQSRVSKQGLMSLIPFGLRRSIKKMMGM